MFHQPFEQLFVSTLSMKKKTCQVAGGRQVDEEAHVVVGRDAEDPTLAQREGFLVGVVHGGLHKQSYRYFQKDAQFLKVYKSTISNYFTSFSSLRAPSYLVTYQ